MWGMAVSRYMPTVSDAIIDRLQEKGAFQDIPEVTAQDLFIRGQQYRNFDPVELVGVAFNEGLSEARDVLRFVESGRFEPFLDNTSDMFARLDRDEKETFTRRNPDLVQWMSAYNVTEELNPYGDFAALASEVLIDGRDRADSDAVPPFEPKAIGDDDLLESLKTRRRSYRNFTPHEIRQILTNGNFEAREVLGRIESGRFDPVLGRGHKFFAPLDPDERRLFARRNPGMMEWISVWGAAQHLIHGDQFFTFSDMSFPFVPTEGV